MQSSIPAAFFLARPMWRTFSLLWAPFYRKAPWRPGCNFFAKPRILSKGAPYRLNITRHVFKAGFEPATRGFPGPLLYQLSYKVLCCACLYNSVRSQAGLQLPGRAVPPEYFKMRFQSFTSGKSNAFSGIHRMKKSLLYASLKLKNKALV